jgi:hypothetical protein
LTHFIYQWLGVGHNGQANTAYSFWSGFGSDIAEFAILGLVWHRINCGVHGCWRIGLRKVPNTEHVVCHKHHPHDRPTAEKVIEDHRIANADEVILPRGSASG